MPILKEMIKNDDFHVRGTVANSLREIDSLNLEAAIGVECGNIYSKGSSKLDRIQKLLKFCFFLIWLPYGVEGIVIDLLSGIYIVK